MASVRIECLVWYDSDMHTPRYQNMKPLILPLWLKVGGWIGFGGLLLIVLSFLFSGFFPTFGTLTIQENGHFKTYSRYDISCVYDQGSVSLSFYDHLQDKKRTIDIRSGYRTIDSRTTINNAVVLDESFINPRNCTRYQAKVTGHGGTSSENSKSLHIYEYQLALDCQIEKGRILADLHGYNCWHR